MKRLVVAVAATVSLLGSHGAVGSAADSSFQVVINVSNPRSELPAAEIQRLFLKKTREWDHGLRVIPVDQTSQSAVRLDFSRDILDRSVGSITKYWLGQVYSGRETPPPVRDSDQAVLEFVASNPGAIGYVSANAHLAQGVKMIAVTK